MYRLRPFRQTINLLQLHPYASLFGLALLLRLLVALVVKQPGFVDAYYYYQIAANWHAGKGLTETTIWNYQAGGLFDPAMPGKLEHAAFTYWTPLATFLPILSFSLFGVSFWAASLPFMLCAAALPPLAYWLGLLVFGPEQRRYSWTMALVMLFPGRYFLYWNAPDNFAPFALISLLTLAAIYKGLYQNDRWLPVAGLLCGLAYLSRSDGILLTVTLVLAYLWRLWQLRSEVKKAGKAAFSPRWLMLGLALFVALLVVSPWLLRNWTQFGAVLPANNSKVLYLRSYQDFFSYGLNLDAQYYFSWGAGNILAQKLQTLGTNAFLYIFEGLFLLGPLFVAGLWATRKHPTLGPFLIYSAVLYLVMSLAFSEIGSHGTIFHSAGGLVALQAGIALAGLEWLGRGKARPFGAFIMVLVAIGVTLYFAFSVNAPGWDTDYNNALTLENWLKQNSTPNDVIMVGEPLSFNYVTGRPAISQASDGLAANLNALKRYNASWFVLGSERYAGLDTVYRDKQVAGEGVELRLAAELDRGIQIYRVIIK
ncbi:MAG TPA: glycosyltransferase family 39 protein [Chloroflexia bacterium]|nr:glycosyltransferase family 39 protein [Chloroflexia bacterium]